MANYVHFTPKLMGFLTAWVLITVATGRPAIVVLLAPAVWAAYVGAQALEGCRTEGTQRGQQVAHLDARLAQIIEAHLKGFEALEEHFAHVEELGGRLEASTRSTADLTERVLAQLELLRNNQDFTYPYEDQLMSAAAADGLDEPGWSDTLDPAADDRARADVSLEAAWSEQTEEPDVPAVLRETAAVMDGLAADLASAEPDAVPQPVRRSRRTRVAVGLEP